MGPLQKKTGCVKVRALNLIFTKSGQNITKTSLPGSRASKRLGASEILWNRRIFLSPSDLAFNGGDVSDV